MHNIQFGFDQGRTSTTTEPGFKANISMWLNLTLITNCYY